MPKVYVSIGSNEQRERNIRAGLDALTKVFGQLELSPVYETPAEGFDGDPFYNLVASFQTSLSVGALSETLKKIEADNGRRRDVPKFSSRTLDIDILTYDGAVGLVDGVELPRDEIEKYAFVLGPLVDIAAQEKHPGLGVTFQEMWAQFPKEKKLMKRVSFS
ncbi:MAG: 2-amino-4-hydroxy-6-hydroxymethyldihydropteridine diphosphokinase [Cellvibrionaceae bacterium]